MLTIDTISKTFFPGTVNERKALQGLSLTLEESDFVTVIGSNGAGKSTLLNTISGRLPIDSGSITIDGAEVAKKREYHRAAYLGRVFQDPMAGTAPDLTIEQNLSLALRRGQRR
ncbi:ATP-binding cassette domain-containing protein, partial [Brevibacterium casei]